MFWFLTLLESKNYLVKSLKNIKDIDKRMLFFTIEISKFDYWPWNDIFQNIMCTNKSSIDSQVSRKQAYFGSYLFIKCMTK